VWREGVAVSENLDEYKYLGLYEHYRLFAGEPLRIHIYVGPKDYLYYRLSGNREGIFIKWAKDPRVLDGVEWILVQPPEKEEDLWV
jgi:hypothetical protein